MTQRHQRSVVLPMPARAGAALQTIRPPRLAAAGFALMCIAGSAFALQGADARNSPLPELIRKLDSSVLSEREDASRELSVLNSDLTLPDLESALDDPTLSAEQRIRLINAAAGRFKTSPRGALGVSFGGFDDDAVVVQGTIERFDSQNKLKPGDRIIAIDGSKVFSLREIRALIISHDPGQEALIVVSRGGQNIEVPVVLGDFSDLDARQTRSISDEELAKAWDVRRARLAQLHAPGVLKSPIDAAGWKRLDRQARAAEIRRLKSASPAPDAPAPGAEPAQDAPQRIVMGGRSREHAVNALADWDAIAARNSRRIMFGRDPRGERAPMNPQAPQPQNFKQLADLFRAQISQIDVALKRQDLPRETRKAIEMQRAEIQMQLKMIEEMPAMER